MRNENLEHRHENVITSDRIDAIAANHMPGIKRVQPN